MTKSLEKYNSSFVTEELKNQESDIIYKLKDKNIFFLIEHQTKVDYTMPMRVLEYEYHIIKSAIDKEFFITIMNLVLKKKLDEEEIKKITNKLRKGDGQMLAVLETLEEENKRLLRQGRKEGRVFGEKRGIKIGIEEGKRQIAKNMLKLKLSIEIISEATGLGLEEIEKIKETM